MSEHPMIHTDQADSLDNASIDAEPSVDAADHTGRNSLHGEVGRDAEMNFAKIANQSHWATVGAGWQSCSAGVEGERQGWSIQGV